MAETNVGKITQIIGAVLDVKFMEGHLPEINDAIEIQRKDGGKLTVEVSQHLGDDTVRCIAINSIVTAECCKTTLEAASDCVKFPLAVMTV